jgi:outer membrane protein insertion porin family
LSKLKFWLIVALLSVLQIPSPARVAGAQDGGPLIKEVRVTGNHLVSDQQILSHIETKPGDTLDKGAIQRDIRRIYNLGRFKMILADVTDVEDGVEVAFIVTEKSVAGEIHIIGNTKIRERTIKDTISLRLGESCEPEILKKDAEAILKLYEEKAFPNASVYVDVETIGPSKARVTYEISEKQKARIRRIAIEGNTVYTDREICKRLSTRTAKVWFLGGVYDEMAFQEDLEVIKTMYAQKGYVEASIVRTAFDFSANGKSMFITIAVNEGPQYHVASVRVEGNEVFADDEIMDLLKLKEGDVFDRSQVGLDGWALSTFYSDAGYIYRAVHPEVTLDEEKKLAHIVHLIREGDLIYLGQIEIANNIKTKDEVIRRELTMYPGERFDANKIRRSTQRMNNLGFFDKERPFEPSTRPSAVEGAEDFIINVNEIETGAFYFGAGFSSEEEILGSVSLDLWNFDITNPPKFTGGGQRLALTLQSGTLHERYSLSFTEPYFLGYPVLFGADVFTDKREWVHNNDFSEERVGTGIRFGKRLSEYVSGSIGLRYEDIEIGDIGDDVSEEIRQEEGSRSTVSLIWAIERNSLDNRFDPTIGTVLGASVEVAGGGFAADTDFVKLRQNYSQYFPLTENEKWIFSIHENSGYVSQYGRSDRVPIFERFFVGGSSSVRGYDERDVGPKSDDIYRDPVGGNVRLVLNLELSYEITDILKAYVFQDSGTAWRDLHHMDASDLRFSVGAGLGITTPMGPLRVDYGIPLNADDDQGSGRFHFRVGLGRFLF